MVVKKKDARAGIPLTEERKAQLQLQKEQALQGLSPTAYGKRRQETILNWIWKWGFSTKKILQRLSETSRHNITDSLVKKGLIQETRTKSGTPRSFFTLTENGLAEVERTAERLHKYEFTDPYRVRQNNLRHDLFAQVWVLEFMFENPDFVFFETPLTSSFLFTEFSRKHKQPDAFLITHRDFRNVREVIAIEVELTKKWERDFDEFRLKVNDALEGWVETKRDGDIFHEKIADKFVLLTDSRAILNAYKDGMKPNTVLPIWEKSVFGKWEIERKIWVSDIRDKFTCILCEGLY